MYAIQQEFTLFFIYEYSLIPVYFNTYVYFEYIKISSVPFRYKISCFRILFSFFAILSIYESCRTHPSYFPLTY